MVGSRASSFGGDIALINVGGGVISSLRMVSLQGFVVVQYIRFRDGIVVLWRRVVTLLLRVYGRDGCRWVRVRWVRLSGLLPMADEVFQVLYRRHDGGRECDDVVRNKEDQVRFSRKGSRFDSPMRTR